MPRPLTFVLLICVVSLLAGCASLPFIPQPEVSPPPTLDPELLTVTPHPTSTPQPTYTPYPTAERLPSRTPFPTFPPRINVTPEAAEGAGGPAATHVPSGARGNAASAAPLPPAAAQPPADAPPAAPFSGYIGIPEAGSDVPELAPILEVDTRNAICGDEILVQLGVINWGNRAAYDFTVEWSAGIDIESGVTVVEELQWGETAIYFRNKPIRYNCEGPTTFTAYVRVDTTNAVPEIREDNNVAEISFMIADPDDND